MLTDVYCSSCTHAVFDSTWGEWKCTKRCIRIYDISKANFCSDYDFKKKNKKEKKKK